MGEVNKRLQEEISYLSNLINTHKKQEIGKYPPKPFTYQYPASKIYRSSAFGYIPPSACRNQSKSFRKTNLIKNQNVKVNPYKIDRTAKNNPSIFKTQSPFSAVSCNRSLKAFPSVTPNKVIKCQNSLPNISVVPKSSVSSETFDSVVKQTPGLVTVLCESKKSVSLGQISKKLPAGVVENKWTPTTAKSKTNVLQARKPNLLEVGLLPSKSQLPRIAKTSRSSLVVKSKYKVINSEKHQKCKDIQNHCFQSKQKTRKNAFQNTQRYSQSHWKIPAKRQWNASRRLSTCYNYGYQYSRWRGSYYGHYHTGVFKKHAMQRKQWKIQFAASHRKLNSSSHEIAKSLTLKPRIVTIGGLLYRASKMKLSRASKSSGKQITQSSKEMKLQTLLIRGIRYQMDPSRKTLKRVSSQPIKKGSPASTIKQGLKRIDLGGSTYIQTQPGVLTKTESAQTRTFVSRVVNRSICRVLAATEKKSRSKNNLYCMFYNRFGRCNKGDQCPYKHDPDKIAVCVRFLRGTCKVVDCPFSHKVAPEKMPVCSFFLQGRCNNDSCPYQHVKVSRSADVCKDFLRGYCPAGQKCKKRHMLVCQEYTQKGSCKNRSKCPMHHPPRKGQKRKHSQCSTVLDASTERTSEQQCRQLASDLPSMDDSVDSSKKCLPLPSYIALEKDEKEDSLPVKPASTVKGEALRIRPCFLSKGTLGVSLPVSQVSKNAK